MAVAARPAGEVDAGVRELLRASPPAPPRRRRRDGRIPRSSGPPSDQWLLLTEADVTVDNAGTRLASESADGVYRIRLPDPGEGLGQGNVEPARAGRWRMPWRVVITGELPTVFASTAVEDLSTPASGDFSWVRPGRASFGWWIDEDASKKEDVLKAFVDLAAEMGWEYSLIDANWHLAPEGAIDRVIAYAQREESGHRPLVQLRRPAQRRHRVGPARPDHRAPARRPSSRASRRSAWSASRWTSGTATSSRSSRSTTT